ncbi:Phosphoheptose isomerase [uncultured Desulfobacterium sp.]|uniref:Phosphoheptose isomerase n=1 Tax=uncultured Desulfobacterium sp. TaxID=201089 RepID=A0A445MWE8_9BACT|nr:Phosphoheptose isomerase [uncultured Desulfobacterium sp.]
MKDIIEKALSESLKIKESFIRKNASLLIRLAEKIATAFTGDRKLMLCGNGGSAADAQHIAAEFVNRFSLERPPLPALALTTDTSIITAIGNDYSFDDVFSKQIKALGNEGDILLAISTSGRSKNVLSATRDARQRGIYVAGLMGRDGGELKGLVDLALVVESDVTARIQESHILAGHIICQLVDYIIFQRH